MSNPIHINRLKVVSCAVAGRPGLSAYQIAVLNGYTGSEEQWLASLETLKRFQLINSEYFITGSGNRTDQNGAEIVDPGYGFQSVW